MEVVSCCRFGPWIVVAVLLASGSTAVGGWEDDLKALDVLDGEEFRRLVYPLVEMAANAYRYPGIIPIRGWTFVDAVAPIHGGVHAVVYQDDVDTGRMVLSFRGTDISGSKSSRADACADEVLWGDTPSFLQPVNCSEFSSETLDYYKQAVDYTRQMLEAHPQASFLLTGHSLGASLAILVAATFSSTPLFPIVAFSSGGTKAILERMSLKLSSDHDEKVYIIADKWDEVMRTSWENQIGTLCLYETRMTADCRACFEDETSRDSCEDFSSRGGFPKHTPCMVEDSTLEVEELANQHPAIEVKQSRPALIGSDADCLKCFFETHYLQHVMDLVVLGNKPICQPQSIRNLAM